MTATAPTTDGDGDGRTWRGVHVAALAGGLLAGLVIRALLLPAPGLAGDLDEFVGWVHLIATRPLGQAYDINLTFPPVMVYVWAALGAVEPAFRTVADASDPAIRVLMKVPPVLADAGLAAGLLVALRGRPGWAVAAALGVFLHPAVIDVSALFGQYESLYVAFGLLAVLLAVGGRPGLAAVALGAAVMTKPQALPFLVPFAAWFLGREGWRGTLRAALIGLATIAILWLPFIPAGGPAGYLRSIQLHQDELYAVLSLRAWNPWWIVQSLAAGGSFVSDQVALLGPFTFRHVGFAMAGAFELVVFLAVLRRPTPRTLALGLAASILVAFTFLTTMHERYAYAAVVFLALAMTDRRVLRLWLAFGAVFTLNLLAAVPPSPTVGELLPVGGLLGVTGSVALTAITAATLWLLLRPPEGAAGEPSEAAREGRPVPAQVVG